MSMLSDRASTSRRAYRRGSIYLYVLASSLLLTILGLGSLAAVRVQVRAARLARDGAEVRAGATSAIELGRLYVKQNSTWRTAMPHGTWMNNRELGDVTFTLQGTDPVDGVLSNSVYDPVVLTATATHGIASHMVQVTLVPVVKPLAVLTSCLTASGQINIVAGYQMTVVGAPLSTNAILRNNATIDGNAEAQNAPMPGTVTGTLTVPGPTKPMPDASVLTWYAGEATTVPYAAIMEKFVLGPGCNTLGPTDPNGLYVIDTSGRDLTLRNCRIYGTLIVLAGSKKVTIDGAVFMQNYRSDFPVLLVQGNVEFKLKSVTEVLSESACVANFNPTGAPYGGVTDADTSDAYPDEIRGLVHIQGDLTLWETTRIAGVVICDGAFTGNGQNTIAYDARLYANPPLKYISVDGMKVSPGTWKQVVQ